MQRPQQVVEDQPQEADHQDAGHDLIHMQEAFRAHHHGADAGVGGELRG